jgi:hypothetical protein
MTDLLPYWLYLQKESEMNGTNSAYNSLDGVHIDNTCQHDWQTRSLLTQVYEICTKCGIDKEAAH